MITVLRLGHRTGRDARTTTHCALVARAFGADAMLYSGERDQGFEDSVRDVVERFGGDFEVKHEKKWRKVLKNFEGLKVHLTVYGLPVEKNITKIRKEKNLLVVIGGEKVPPEVYELADHNISVTTQPHSEVAALAIFLDRCFKGKELDKEFKGKVRIVPQKNGKKVIQD